MLVHVEDCRGDDRIIIDGEEVAFLYAYERDQLNQLRADYDPAAAVYTIVYRFDHGFIWDTNVVGGEVILVDVSH